MWLKAQKPFPRPLLQKQPALLQVSHVAQVFCPKVTAAWAHTGAALAAHGMLLQGAASISLGRMGLVWGIKLDKWVREDHSSVSANKVESPTANSSTA